MDDKDLYEKETVDIEVDPQQITLAELLTMAESQGHGTLSIKGEMEDGTVQWGVVITCGDNAGQMMESLQITVDAGIAKWVASKAN